ncbi:MAG TPA: hypothetical protein VHE13_02605 [Opitutus sp.]|nr:hypothetical protein [Opitutus sp.]
MSTPNDSLSPTPLSLWPALLTGGLLAGVLDAASAIHTFGWRMFYGIASGLVGMKANPQAGGGGAAIWLLGVALHFLIALSAAAIYCHASKPLPFLRERFLLGGVICGIAVYLVMNLIVLPLSAVPFPVGPFTVQGLRMGLVMTTVLVGLPISISLWFFSRRATRPAA